MHNSSTQVIHTHGSANFSMNYATLPNSYNFQIIKNDTYTFVPALYLYQNNTNTKYYTTLEVTFKIFVNGQLRYQNTTYLINDGVSRSYRYLTSKFKTIMGGTVIYNYKLYQNYTAAKWKYFYLYEN